VNDNPGPSKEMDDEVVRRLAAYGRSRLEPSTDAAERMRATVMAAAEGAPVRPRLRLVRPSGMRRWAYAAMLAAVLALAVGGTALGAGPSSPLYPVRLWLETVTLPADVNARTDAELNLLQERIDEAAAAAASHDQSAVAAALAAYRAEIEALLATAGDDGARLAKLEAALGTHLIVLETLSTKVPEQAREAITNAIDKSSNAVDRVHVQQSHGPTSTPGPDETPKPEPSNKPDHTPHGPPDDHPSGGPPGQGG
jgi:hypothetical protein